MKAKAPAWSGMNGTEMQLYPLILHMCALFHPKHLSDTYTVTPPPAPVTKSLQTEGFCQHRCWLRTFPSSQGSSEIIQPRIHHQTGRATSLPNTQNFFWNPTKFPGRLQNQLHKNLELPVLSFEYRKEGIKTWVKGKSLQHRQDFTFSFTSGTPIQCLEQVTQTVSYRTICHEL